MAKHIPIGQPENEHERNAIAFLKSKFNNSFTLISNFELRQGKEIFEIDLAIIAPQCVFVVDIKNISGHIDIYDKWIPENRAPFSSPLAKLRKHAKIISSVITESNKVSQSLSKIHIQAAILFTSLHTTIADHNDRDQDYITYLDQRCLKFFQSSALIPDHRFSDVSSYFDIVERAIRGKSQPKSASVRYRDWILEQQLGGGDRYTEYRARHSILPASFARLQIYEAEPYPDPDDPDPEKKRIFSAFAALRKINHQNIQSVQECFETEEGDRFILVLDDIKGQSLNKNIFSLYQKFDIISQILSALDYAHEHGVIHRNLSPNCILVNEKGKVILTGFEYARTNNRTSTIAHEILDSIDYNYQPLECQRDPSQASVASDIFSVGAVFYQLLTGKKPFTDANDLSDRSAIFPIPPSKVISELSSVLDRWLQKLCSFKPQDRFSTADLALQELSPIVNLKRIDLSNLAPNSSLNNRYLVKKKLGHGSFGVTYLVHDVMGNTDEVMKLVTRNSSSLYERAKQEYGILRSLPEHPHIVKIRYSGELEDETPFIIFDYIEGQDLASLLASEGINLVQSLKIGNQTAQGLIHLHQHQVYHQDIKPSNLLLTKQGIKIIDFNISVSEADESPVSAGTKRYLQPDYDFKKIPSTEEKIDRDLYALGMTLYECATGHYPFMTANPTIGQLPRHPRDLELATPISDALANFLCQTISPLRRNRFSSATEFLHALEAATKPSNSKEKNASEEMVVPKVLPEIREYPSQKVQIKVAKSQNIRVALNYEVILDPTKNYCPTDNVRVISSELEWLKYFFREDKPYWISGSRLCELTREWLSLHDKDKSIVAEKLDPRMLLQQTLGESPIPDTWTNEYIITLCDRFTNHSSPISIPELLAEVTNEDIWIDPPSAKNLAQWLLLDLPQELVPIAKLWSQQRSRLAEEVSPALAYGYRCEDRQHFLRQWLGLVQPIQNLRQELGDFPIPLPNELNNEFIYHWQQQILQSDGQVLDTLSSELLCIEKLASIIYNVLVKKPEWITRDRLAKLPYNPSQRSKLLALMRPKLPQELSLDASVSDALNWATKEYLPYRIWEVNSTQVNISSRQSDRLGESFAIWLFSQYPKLKTLPVGDSPLNYNSTYIVTQLTRNHPVLWIVVDGLGWLDHQELLQYLTENGELHIETELSPRISLLPTKTEYAKWSLYSQLPCDNSDWSSEIAQAFPKIGIGKYYTNDSRHILRQDLQNAEHNLYCWDALELDHLYHEAKDWQTLYQSDRPATLRKLSDLILDCVNKYPQPKNLKVVIASDHGQLIGEVPFLPTPPSDVEAQGRIAIGSTSDSRCFVLDAKRFGLPHDVSVPKGAFCFTKLQGKGIGLHGGLFPEEAIVGVSVLASKVDRKRIGISLSGKGKSKQIEKLKITVDNRLNNVAIHELILFIHQLPELHNGKLISLRLDANQKDCYIIDVLFPELPTDRIKIDYQLTGELRFQFADLESDQQIFDAAIEVEQMFSSGFVGGIDEFL